MKYLNTVIITIIVITSSSCSFKNERPVNSDNIVLFKGASVINAEAIRPRPAKWWQDIGDEDLGEIINRALSNNFSIEAARHKLSQVQALGIISERSLQPTLEGSLGASRNSSGGSGSASIPKNNYKMGLSAKWEVDLWGRVRAERSAWHTDLEQSRENIQAAALIVTAEISSTYLSLAELLERTKLINMKKVLLVDLEALTEMKRRQGLVSNQELVEASKRITEIDAIISSLALELEKYNNKLSVLLGSNSSTILKTQPKLIELPALPAISSNIILGRPNISMALRSIEGARYRLRSAKASRFPALSFSGSGGWNSSVIDTLLNSWTSSLASAIIVPILDQGRRQSEVAKQKSVVEEKISLCRGLAAEAFAEIRTAMVQEETLSKVLVHREKNLELSKKNLSYIEQKYLNGRLSKAEVIMGELSVIDSKIGCLNLKLGIRNARVSIYRALGPSDIERNLITSLEKHKK